MIFDLENGFAYVKVNNEFTIFSKKNDAINLSIPSTYEGGLITKIGMYSFKECNNLKKLIIPGSIKEIEKEAFVECKNLESITLNEGLEIIGFGAFGYCNNLKEVYLPKSLKEIDGEVFYGCDSLTNIYYEGSIDDWCKIEIKTKDFMKKHFFIKENNKYIEVKDIEVKEGITRVGYAQFSNMKNVNSITIPSTITDIGNDAFYGCDNLKYNVYDNGLYLGNVNNPYLVFIKAKSKDIKTCIVNENTKIIYDKAFECCKALKNISIPNSIISIMQDAFRDSNSLKYNVYDNGLYLGNNDNPYLIFIKAKSKDIKTCTLNDNTKMIYDYAFEDSNYLTSVKLNDGLNFMGHSIFTGCKSLNDVRIPSTLEKVVQSPYNTSMFELCDNLKYNIYDNGLYLGNNDDLYLVFVKTKSSDIETCNINENTKIICNNAFNNCKNLTSIFIPKNVTLIEKGAFASSNLKNIKVDLDNKVYFNSDNKVLEKDTLKVVININYNKPSISMDELEYLYK